MKKAILLSCVFIFSLFVSAQTHLSGTIFKSDGKPSKGTEVRLKIQSKKVKTKKDGKFFFDDILIGNDSLMIKIAKDKDLVIAIKNDSNLLITLNKEDALVDNGVIKETITYRKKAKKIKDSNIITAEDIAKTNTTRFIDIITRVPGVSRSVSDKGTTVFIRGKNSWISSNEPLFILDKSEVPFSTLESLNVFTIESIEVNKAGFGYGNKGANGVIIVTTKK